MKLPFGLKVYLVVLTIIVGVRTAVVTLDGGYDTFGGMLLGFWLPDLATAPISWFLNSLWPGFFWSNYWLTVLVGGSVNAGLIAFWYARRGRPT